MASAITQKRPQMRDNVLERLAIVLLALDLDEGFDVGAIQSRKAALG